MLQLSHTLDGSEDWDTNWARKFLKIPQDQLNKLESISEWCTSQILTTENAAKQRVDIVSTEVDSSPRNNFVFEKLSQSNSTTKNIDNPEVSNLLQTAKNKLINFTITENKLTRSASLNFLNLSDKFLNPIKLRPSHSAPNIKELALSNSDLTSVEHHKISATDPQKCKTSRSSRSKLIPSKRKINETFIVTTQFNKMESFSQPEMGHNRFPPVMVQLPIEQLTDKILNHKYLKESVNSTRKSEDTQPFKECIQEGNKQNISSSPCKEPVSPTKENLKQDNLGHRKSLELSKSIFQAPKDIELQGQVPKAVSSPSDMLNEDYVQEGIPAVRNSVKESGINVSPDKKKDMSNNEHNLFVASRETTKNEESNALSVNNEESFGSQLIPCGQPVPVDADPCSQHTILMKANIETQDKSADIATNVAVSAGSSNGNLIIQNSPHTDVRSSGTKRKRKSKIDTPKKMKETKHSIHYTTDQVRSMLEMIKMLHSET